MAEILNGTGQILIRIQEGQSEILAGLRALTQHVHSLERRILALEQAAVNLHMDVAEIRVQITDMDTRISTRLERIERTIALQGGDQS